MTFRLLDFSIRNARLTVIEITALIPRKNKFWIKTSRIKVIFLKNFKKKHKTLQCSYCFNFVKDQNQFTHEDLEITA